MVDSDDIRPLLLERLDHWPLNEPAGLKDRLDVVVLRLAEEGFGDAHVPVCHTLSVPAVVMKPLDTLIATGVAHTGIQHRWHRAVPTA